MSIEKFHSAMDLVAELNKSHGLNFKGKQYTEVSKRVEAFRLTFGGDYGIDTDIIQNNERMVVVKATIRDKDGFIVGSGLAEEIRGSSNITKTSAVEVCETSAIGRALASLGLHGGQYASANEMEGVGRKEKALKAARITPTAGDPHQVNEPEVNPVHRSPEQAAIIPTEERIDALITFYENCDADKFAAAEDKFNKMINSTYIDEDQYLRMIEAHEKRKLELMI